MLYVAVSQIIHETVMSFYSDKLAHVQVVNNCPYSIARMCTREDTLAYISGPLSIDEVMSYDSHTTLIFINESKLHKVYTSAIFFN